MTFSDLHLIEPILRAAAEAGYKTPSPIQGAAIPPVLAGRDVLGCAQTGTGKTAAFAMPILQRLAGAAVPRGARPIRALVLTPTRELALQIDESFADYGRHLPLRHCVIFGGVGQAPQVEALKRGVDVLTATPGRLNDLIGQGFVDLSRLEIFVLDEADRMLDMGFVRDVKRVIAQLPPKRQTLLFSATMPAEIEELAGAILTRPKKIMVTPPATTVEAIEQSVYFVDKANKRRLLAALLQKPEVTSALVFTRTKHGADRVVRELAREGVAAMAIHGNKSQSARQDALAKFKDGRVRVLIATDIAARGIDVSGLSHVFNYDLPNVPETYVHRIGRTGRAGRAGVAISFCDAEEKAYLADIEKLTRIHIPPVDHPWPMSGEQPPELSQTMKKTPGRTARLKEERQVEQQSVAQRPAMESGAPAEKKHRRRGGRRHKSGAAQPAVQPPMQPPQPALSAARQKSAAAPKKAAADAPGQPRTEKKPKPAAARQTPKKSGQPPKQPRPQAREPERDDSIQLIARRAPTQKYASFEEYMKAHENNS